MLRSLRAVGGIVAVVEALCARAWALVVAASGFERHAERAGVVAVPATKTTMFGVKHVLMLVRFKAAGVWIFRA